MALAFTAVVLIAIAGIVIFTTTDSNRQLANYMRGGGFLGLENLITNLEAHYQDTGSWQGVELHFNTSTRGNNNSRMAMYQFTLTDSDGIVQWSNSGDEEGLLFSGKYKTEGLKLLDPAENVVGYLLVNQDGGPVVNQVTPFIERMNRAMVLAGTIAGLAALFLAILISRQLLKPVSALMKASESISSGDLTARVKISSKDEFHTLGNTFNQMAENVQSSDERKKALTADVAHELRTPLSVQKAQLEAMIDGVIPISVDNLQAISNQTDVLSRLVDDLRTLALTDSRELQMELQLVRLDEILESMIDSLRPQISLGDTKIVYKFDQNSRGQAVLIDTGRLSQVMQNIFTNAMRYGKNSGIIQVSLIKDESSLVVQIHDDGNGIPEEALPHLFERFYRHDKARSRDSGGTGLGLSIAKNLVSLMNGEISAMNHPAGGAVFEVRFPIVAEPQKTQ
jgi:signal transduction histidine kinase